MIRSITCSAAILSLAVASTAHAEPAGDRAAAEALFRDGRDLLDKGDVEHACPKFEKSLALFQSASAALNLARCYGRAGHLAAAWTTLVRAEELNEKTDDPARKSELAALAATLRAELEPRVPHVRVLVSPDVSGTVVVRNGIEVPAPLLGAPLPVDPGTYEIRVAAPGYEEVVQHSTVIEGQTVVVDVKLRRIDVPLERGVEPRGAPGPTDRATAEGDLPVWPWLVGAGGVAALGVGVGFAVDYGVVRGDVDAACPNGRCDGLSPADADALLGRWDRDLALAITFGAVGAGLVTTSVVGLALAGSDPPTQPTTLSLVPMLAPNLGGAVFIGTF